MLAMYRRRFLIVVLLAFIWSSVVVWLVFKPSLLHAIGQHRILSSFLPCVGIVSICFYYYLAKRFPHFAIGLTVLAVGIVLTLGWGIANLVFDLDNIWLNRSLTLGQVLSVLALLIFVWQAVKKLKGSTIKRSIVQTMRSGICEISKPSSAAL